MKKPIQKSLEILESLRSSNHDISPDHASIVPVKMVIRKKQRGVW